MLGRARIRVGGKLIVLAGGIASAIVDLGLAIAPEISTAPQPQRRPLLGLAIVVLLVAGLALTAGGAVWAIREAVPHREVKP